MNKQLLLSCLFVAAFYSCKKDDSKSSSMEYAINGAKDTTYAYQKLTEKLKVQYTSGDKSNVTLTVSGLPKGIEAKLGSPSGTPDFETDIEFSHNDYVTAGIYPVRITGNINNKTTELKLTVKGSCGDFLSGIYPTEVRYATSGELLNNTRYTVSVKPDDANRLYFYEGSNTDADFYADVDCAASTLTIPAQTKPGTSLQYSGSGKLDTKKRQLDFTVTYGALPALKFTMTKQ